MKQNWILALALCGAIFSPLAAGEIPSLGEYEVTAAAPDWQAASDESGKTVFDEEAIRKSGASTVAGLLENTPGISVNQTGEGPGGVSSVSIRGAGNGNTLVLIDGVVMNDPMDIYKAFNLAGIPLSAIESVEIIKGPQSSFFGSEASGGIVSIKTKRGLGASKAFFSLGGNSSGSWNTGMLAQGNVSNTRFMLSVQREEMNGLSQAASSNGSPYETDPSKLMSIDGNVRWKFFEGLTAGAQFGYRTLESSIDDGAYQDDADRTLTANDGRLRLWGELKAAPFYKTSLSVSGMLHDKTDSDADDYLYQDAAGTITNFYTSTNYSLFKSMSMKADWLNCFEILPETLQAYIGADTRLDSGEETDVYGGWETVLTNLTRSDSGVYGEIRAKLFDALQLSGSVRSDSDSAFGTALTYRAGGLYDLKPTGTVFRAQYGTGFKAPSLYQLYSSYGSSNLQAEKSSGADASVIQKLFGNLLTLEVTGFYNHFENKISFDSSSWKYTNTARAQTYGAETGMKFRLSKMLSIDANYTYTESEDLDTGLALLKTPRHQGSIKVDYSPSEEWTLSCGAFYYGKRYDYGYVELEESLNPFVGVRYRKNDFEAFVRAENLWNSVTPDTLGYTVPGFNLSAGIRSGWSL